MNDSRKFRLARGSPHVFAALRHAISAFVSNNPGMRLVTNEATIVRANGGHDWNIHWYQVRDANTDEILFMLSIHTATAEDAGEHSDITPVRGPVLRITCKDETAHRLFARACEIAAPHALEATHG